MVSAFEISGGSLAVPGGRGCPSFAGGRGFGSDPPGARIATAGSAFDIAPGPEEGVPCTSPSFGAFPAALQGAGIATVETFPSGRLYRPESIPDTFSSSSAYRHPSERIPAACGSCRCLEKGFDCHRLEGGRANKKLLICPTRGPRKSTTRLQ